MTDSKANSAMIENTRNTARFFTESRQIAWVLAVATFLWGIYGYCSMPKRKDPWFPARYIVVICPWPGADAEKVEQLVTRKIEEKIAENPLVRKIESVSRNDVSLVTVEIDNRLIDTAKEFDDIKLRLDGIRGLPQGSGPIEFLKDFDETCALMLTVASPRADDVEIGLRSHAIRRAIEQARLKLPSVGRSFRVTLLHCFPQSISSRIAQRQRDLFAEFAVSRGLLSCVQKLDGDGFVGIDALSKCDDQSLAALMVKFGQERLRASQMHPDVWSPIIVRNPEQTEAKIRASAGDKYTYRELDDFTDLIRRKLQTIPQVAKISRLGTLREQINLDFSQERVAAYEAELPDLRELLSRRNISEPVGELESAGRNVPIRSSGELKNEQEIGDLLLTISGSGAPVYMRDLFDISRGYETPARYLNFYNWRDDTGNWHRTRAVTLAIQMRHGEQIAEFGKAVDGALSSLRQCLPGDLVMARVSDQPLQVSENVDLFMTSLFEAVILVVVVTLVGFWEWRAALLIAFSIPLTLAMTFGMMHVLGVDFQQVSIASLIIALGLLVDDPVVAGDAIKRELAGGHPPPIAAWLGPTKLAKAILFATLTNIAAYLPLLAMTGRVGQFIHSLPIVITASLVSSRIISMTFVPLLGLYILRPTAKRSAASASRQEKVIDSYYRVGSWAIRHRWMVLGSSLVLLASSCLIVRGLTVMFFPKDLSYLSYVDVWLPESAPLSETNVAAKRAEVIVRRVCAQYAQQNPTGIKQPREVLDSITTFVGGGGPRFWYSVTPELEQLNYAQLVIKVKDKYDTAHLVPLFQEALSDSVPGTLIDVRQLETGPPINMPVSVRIFGPDARILRQIAGKLVTILRSIPQADRIRDDWDADNFAIKLDVDPDRINLVGFSNRDVANVSLIETRGRQIGSLREEDKQIPVVSRLRAEEGGGLYDIQNLYLYSTHSTQKIPLRQVAKVSYGMQTSKIRRRNQFRAISVSCFPVPGVLPSQVLALVQPRLDQLVKSLPPGYWLEFGGEEEEQLKCYADMPAVMVIMIASIFICLVIQFRSVLKPLIVFAGIPYGFMGALAALVIMGAPLSFMAVLGIASLVGVIVSHVIVLLDFIEERQGQGLPLERVLLDACLLRLRPVLITVAATVFALLPLAAHGGPLWEPLCYAEMGGLTVATGVTLVLVPVLYAILALDLKWIKISTSGERDGCCPYLEPERRVEKGI